MGTNVYAFTEIMEEGSWIFNGKWVEDEEYDFDLVPENIAPTSWGKFNFAVYYEASGEKDLPPDLGATLQNFINQYWPEPNRPSWMTIAEMRSFFESDQAYRFAHLDFEGIAAKFDLPEDHIRVVFWADQ